MMELGARKKLTIYRCRHAWFVVNKIYILYYAFCWFWCPEAGTSFIDRAQLSRFLRVDGDRVQCPKHFNKDRMEYNAQKVSCMFYSARDVDMLFGVLRLLLDELYNLLM
jgi:predicted RNA-binding Zn-ribbon protein involved in translation (DUF1610 family)